MADPESTPPPAKKAKLAEEEEEPEIPLPQIYFKLDAVQERLLQHQEESEIKIAALKAKLRQLAAPIYEERRKLTQKLPGFWANAIQAHPTLGEIFRPLDKKIFSKLLEITVEESFDPKDNWYSIAFIFAENEWFEGPILWKKFVTKDGVVNVLSSGVKPKPEHKRFLEKEETFLNWFSPDDQDTELGALIRDEVWANPLLVAPAADESDKDDDEEDSIDPTAMDEQLALAAAWDSESE